MMGKTKQRGNAMTEYLVATLVVLVIFGAIGDRNNSVITEFLNLMGTGFDRFSGFMSLP